MSSCSGHIVNCIVRQNKNGGIIGSTSSNDDNEIYNCIVSGNSSDGIYVYYGKITNCTIVGNTGNGIFKKSCGNVIIHNNIIVRNRLYGIHNQDGCGAILKYNNVWDNLLGNYSNMAPGPTDTHEDPLFAIAGYWDVSDNWVEGDYHLKSIAGRWQPDSHTWVNDEVTSLCIDAGEPIGGALDEPAPNGSRINQGAYGGTEYASKSPWGPEPYCREYLPGDTNYDCRIDLIDLAILASNWLSCNLVPEDACLE